MTVQTVDGVRVHQLDADQSTSCDVIQSRRWRDGDVVLTDAVAVVVIGQYACAITTPSYGLDVLDGDGSVLGAYGDAYRVARRLAKKRKLKLRYKTQLLPEPEPRLDNPHGLRRDQVAKLKPTTTALTSSQRRTLRTIVDKGGEVNGYEGQPGIHEPSIAVLVRRRLLDSLGTCDCWETDGTEPCNIKHEDVDTPWCYRRVRITEFGMAINSRLIGKDDTSA